MYVNNLSLLEAIK